MLHLHRAAQDAIDAGDFLLDRSDRGSGPRVPEVLGIAADVAAGMACLHAHSVLHGDLNCSATRFLARCSSYACLSPHGTSWPAPTAFAISVE